jgi:hypothetical protein
VHKVDDDLLSATRLALMDLRHAKPLGPSGSFSQNRVVDNSAEAIRRRSAYDIWTGEALP